MPLKIYLSSTYEDLKGHREAVYRQLRSLRHDVIAMEDYVAADQRPADKCLRDVREADVYVGIFGWRYGYVPKERNPKRLSITELELREASRRKKPRLLFLLNDKTPWPPQMMDSVTRENEQGKRIQALRRELMSERLVGTFESPEELAAKALAALVSWQTEESASAANAAEPTPVLAGAGAEPRGDSTNLWKPGSTIRVRFLEKAGANLADRIVRLAQIWTAYANLRFVLSEDPDAEVRVGFSDSMSSWSYEGTSCLQIDKGEATMNLGWIHEGSPLEEMEKMVLHEFGHALGLHHEHNNPAAEIPWKRKAVYGFFCDQQGWTKEATDQYVFSTWPAKTFPFAKPFDPLSIMAYQFPPGLTGGEHIFTKVNMALSAGDKAFISRLYPYGGVKDERRPAARKRRGRGRR